MPEATRTIGRRVVAAVALAGTLVALLAVLHRASRPLDATDIFWQVRTGELALESGRVPDRDPFSYTMPGAAWNNHEWLFEVLAALFHRAAGWGGFRLWTAALMTGTAAALAAVAARRSGAAAGFLAAALFVVLAGYKMAPNPQGLSMTIFLAAFVLFRGRRLACSPLRWAALVAWMLVWGNLTAESLMFLPFLILDQAALRGERGAAGLPALPPPTRHALLCALACAAPLVNPPQSSVLDYALAGTAVNRAYNVEFASILAPATTVSPSVKGGALAFMVVYALWALVVLARSRDRWPALRRVGPGLLAVALAAAFERNLWLLLLPAGRLAADGAALARRAGRALLFQGALAAAGWALLIAWAAGAAWTPVAAARDLISPGYRASALDGENLPVACLERIAGDRTVRRLFALRMWAGYAIWRLPGVRVFIDGRNREYPVIVHQMADHVWEGGPIAGAILDATGTDAVLAIPGWIAGSGLSPARWEVAARGPSCELYRRRVAR
jgi:hypothetical protein